MSKIFTYNTFSKYLNFLLNNVQSVLQIRTLFKEDLNLFLKNNELII